MIIKGASRGAGGQLASYLASQKNERVHVLEVSGTSARDLSGALREMEASRHATRSAKALYHAQVSPDRDGKMTPEQWRRAADVLGKKLGLDGQPRALVLHTKGGRDHLHIVWSRVDAERGRVISDSQNYRRHEQAARQLESELDHKQVQGVHTRGRGLERPARTPERRAMQQGERLGLDARDVTAEVQRLYRSSDSGRAFAAALAERGYTLARGDRRDVVLIDSAGGVHSMTRRAGVKKSEMEMKMADIDKNHLPALAQVQAERGAVERQTEQRQVERQTEQRLDNQARERQRLYAAYQAERRAARDQNRGPDREEIKRRYAEITARARAEREEIRRSQTGEARVIALSVAAFRAVEARDRLRDTIAQERAAARPPEWRGWLDKRAQGGDKQAAQYVAWLDRRGVDQGQRREQDNRRQDDLKRDSVTRGVTHSRAADGRGVEYKIDGRVAVEDRGRQVLIHESRKAQAIALGLALYVQQHGPEVVVQGDDMFKQRVATVAAERGMDLSFKDPRVHQIFEARVNEITAEREAAKAERGLGTSLSAAYPGRPPPTPSLSLAGPTPAQAAQQARDNQHQQEQERSR